MPKANIDPIRAAVALAMFVIIAIMAVLAMQTATAEVTEGAGQALPAAPEAMTLRPLSLELSIAVVVDMSLMTLGLVILFRDDGPDRYQAR